MPKKQRHTAKRIFERLPEEGYRGGYTQVKAKARELKQLSQEAYMPLAHRPGEAQMDVGEVTTSRGFFETRRICKQLRAKWGISAP